MTILYKLEGKNMSCI